MELNFFEFFLYLQHQLTLHTINHPPYSIDLPIFHQKISFGGFWVKTHLATKQDNKDHLWRDGLRESGYELGDRQRKTTGKCERGRELYGDKRGREDFCGRERDSELGERETRVE